MTVRDLRANARALSQMTALAGDTEASVDYAARAAGIKSRVQESLWSPRFQHFIDRYKADNQHVNYWQPIRGRELVGYVPWTFDLPDDDALQRRMGSRAESRRVRRRGAAYRLQIRRDEEWYDVKATAGVPIGNGITHVRWSSTAASQVRLVMTQPAGRSIRLVEVKLF